MDEYGVVRVKSKFCNKEKILILLPKEGDLTKLIVSETHEKVGHSGIYSVLKQLRQQFWIIHAFSVVKKILKSCIVCKRLNAHPIKLNQNVYRDFRAIPINKPFSTVFIDYIGPIEVKIEGNKCKVWLLILTCMYSRAINMKICRTADVNDFLRAIQLHIFDFGIFSFCISDLGSQIRAGANIISTFIDDYETKSFFESRGISNVKFQQYPKGNSSLGSVVESCVKLVKHIMFKSIRTFVLDYFEFEMIVHQTIHLVNKRPIAFKDGLRSLKIDETPDAITPEMLVKGYDTTSVNIIPYLQVVEDDTDPDYGSGTINAKYSRLNKVRSNLIDQYQSEFISTLMKQATDKKGRYKPKPHQVMKTGDVVLLVDKFAKRYNYELGRIKSVDTNSIGEVTAAHVFKGKTRETVYRHASSLILLLSCEESVVEDTGEAPQPMGEPLQLRPRSTRRAATLCKERLAALEG